MIVKPRRVQGLQASPSVNKKFKLIAEKGPGVFVSAFVTKQGGANHLSQVALYIDGVNVVALTFLGADNAGLDQANNSGIKIVKENLYCFTIQFNEPLYYQKDIVIEFSTGTDSGIAQVMAVAVLGNSCSYPA